jgi:hypothetical protein
MRKQLRFRWTAGVTTTAGHVATSLIPTDTFTQDFINKAIGISAGVYGFDPSYLDFKDQSIKGGVSAKDQGCGCSAGLPTNVAEGCKAKQSLLQRNPAFGQQPKYRTVASVDSKT